MSQLIVQNHPSFGLLIDIPNNYTSNSEPSVYGHTYTTDEIETVIKIMCFSPEDAKKLKQLIIKLLLTEDKNPVHFVVEL